MIAGAVALVSCVATVFTFLATTWTGWRNDVRSQAAEHQQFIRETYAAYMEMSHFQMEHPEIAHETVDAAQYASEVQRVKLAFPNLSPADKAQMRLREEAYADYVFSSFERLVYAANAPESTRTPEVNRFLGQQLKYYSEHVLPNPRLMYYWRDDHSSQYYDAATQAYYRKAVTNYLRAVSDSAGPFQ